WRNLYRRESLALRRWVHWLSEVLQLSQEPISMLGETYFTTTLYHSSFRDSIPRYYLTSVDGFDDPLFWPLTAHEMAHCKFDETGHVLRAFEEARQKRLDEKIGAEPCERRLEQAMGDIVATRLI